jgi:V/A-type H+/Na+-transporting ATPase subunit I
MFSAVPMVQLRVLILEQDAHRVLAEMGRFGTVQLVPAESGPDTGLLPARDRTEELSRCARIRVRAEEIRTAIGIRPSPDVRGTGKMTLETAEERLTVMERHVMGPSERLRRLGERQKELSQTRERLSPYQGIPVSLEEDRSPFLHFVTGSVSLDDFDRAHGSLGEKGILFPLRQKDGRQFFVGVSVRERMTELAGVLDELGFEEDHLPVVPDHTVDSLWKETDKEKGEVAAEAEALRADLNTRAREFGEEVDRIQAFVERQCRLLEATRTFSRTENTVLIAGWVPAGSVPVLEGRVREITAGSFIFETTCPDPSCATGAPVLLRHSRLLQPFVTLVSTYGLPGYRELEPTLFVALSYLLMFGAMFGDAGHGAILMAGGLSILVIAPKKMRDFGILLLFAGSSSILFGIVYGSYFGIESLKGFALWHDPLEGDPIRLMFVTVGFGVVMISLGLMLNIINRFRRRDIMGCFLDKFGIMGLVFYWGILALLIDGPFFTSRGLVGLAVVLFLILPVMGWMAKGPIEYLAARGRGTMEQGADGLMGAMTESFVGAFEAILSYLANTMSFIRLAAYAMSHAALLAASFMLAAQVRDFPFGGGLWAVVVILLGNVVAIVLEGIIASVQALRLEYYEFFGKFFSGDGQPFRPFSLAEGGEE